MHFINPFKGLRPNEKLASSVVIPSTDHLSKEEISNITSKNNWSYLNILEPNIINQSIDEQNLVVKKQFELMKEKSILFKENKKSFYLYKIQQDEHIQLGIMGTVNLSSYDNLHIRGHEEIYLERAQERTSQMLNLNAQIGPIYVVFQDNDELDNFINNFVKLHKPNYSFNSLDKCNHSLWTMNNSQDILNISKIFNKINKIYIADGHHRMEAMIKLSEFKKHQNPDHNGKELYNYVMVAAFPKSQSRILDYNRLVKDLYGYSSNDFIKQVKKSFIVNKIENMFKPKKSKSFGMYIDNNWYSLELKNEPKENLFHINNLDINLLHYYLLEPILGIGDPRYDNRLDFISGFKGLDAIEHKVNTKEVAVGFSLFPTQIEDVISFADKKLTMPPKSTWFDPKPLDGLIAYDFE